MKLSFGTLSVILSIVEYFQNQIIFKAINQNTQPIILPAAIAWGVCELFFIIEAVYFSTQPSQEDNSAELDKKRSLLSKKVQRRFRTAVFLATILNFVEALIDLMFSYGDMI